MLKRKYIGIGEGKMRAITFMDVDICNRTTSTVMLYTLDDINSNSQGKLF